MKSEKIILVNGVAASTNSSKLKSGCVHRKYVNKNCGECILPLREDEYLYWLTIGDPSCATTPRASHGVWSPCMSSQVKLWVLTAIVVEYDIVRSKSSGNVRKSGIIWKICQDKGKNMRQSHKPQVYAVIYPNPKSTYSLVLAIITGCEFQTWMMVEREGMDENHNIRTNLISDHPLQRSADGLSFKKKGTPSVKRRCQTDLPFSFVAYSR